MNYIFIDLIWLNKFIFGGNFYLKVVISAL